MNRKLLSILACPVCHGELEYSKKDNELHCEKDRLAFPVRKGVPILLEMDARSLADKNNQHE